MRLFIAVRCPSAVTAEVAAWQAELREAASGRCRFVAPEAMHLTLRFLGELPSAQAAQTAVVEACRDGRAFPLALRGAGTFPGLSAARVIWAGVEDPAGGLRMIAAAVEAACRQAGLGAARQAFSPHLTVARLRDGAHAPQALRERIEAARGHAFGGWRAETVELIHSTLTPAGPVYRTLLTGRLAGG